MSASHLQLREIERKERVTMKRVTSLGAATYYYEKQ